MHVFYDLKEFSLDEKRKLLEDAKKVCYHWKVEILDCASSWRRERILLKFEDALNKFDDKCHTTLVHRSHFKSEFFEISFRTMTEPDYFLWIYLSVKDGLDLVKRYKL